MAIAKPSATCASPLEQQQDARVDRQHGAAQLVVLREEIAEAMGQAQHPLAYWNMRQDAVHEPRGALGHTPAPAARAEAAALAGKGYEPLEGAVAAAEPREAVREHAAREEIPKLLLGNRWPSA